MKPTSKTLLTYLACATALVALLATAGNVIGQGKATPRPEKVKPEAKKKDGFKVASYTPITVTKVVQTPPPVRKGGLVVRGKARRTAAPGDLVTYTFSIADFQGFESVELTTECREISTFSPNSGYTVATGNNGKQTVYQSGNNLVDSLTFTIEPAQTVSATLVFPSGAAGKMFLVGITGTAENENDAVDFAGGDIIVIE